MANRPYCEMYAADDDLSFGRSIAGPFESIIRALEMVNVANKEFQNIKGARRFLARAVWIDVEGDTYAENYDHKAKELDDG